MRSVIGYPRVAQRPVRPLLLLLALLGVGLPPPPHAGAAPDAARIEKLIEQLGSDDEQQRQEAGKRLEQIGEPALGPLRRAARGSTDPDVRLRAGLVVRAIQKKLWSEVRRFEGHKGWVFRVALTPDGRRAVSCGDAIRVWDLESGKCLRTFGLNRGGWGLSVAPDGKHVLCSSFDRNVYLYELETGKEVKRFPGHKGEVWVAVLSPDGEQVLTGSYDRTLRLWDVKTGKEEVTFEGVQDFPRCAAFAPDGKRVAVGHFFGDNRPGTIRLWDVKTGKEVRSFPGHSQLISAVAFSPDGKRLASSSFDGTVRLWDVESGKELKRFVTGGKACDWVTFTPDGRRLVSTGHDDDPTVRVWDVATGKELHRYEGHTGAPIAVVVTPDGRRALSGGKDGTLRLWPLPR